MSYDAKTIWQHWSPEFKRTIHGQSPEIIQHYIDKCCGSLLSQGIPWTIVVQLRVYITDSIKDPFKPRKLDFEVERETSPWKPTILEIHKSKSIEREMQIPEYKIVNNEIVQPDRCVEFTALDWKRTKIQIELYNQQIRKNSDLMATLLIRYHEL
jgi:hypothetical protein